MKLNPKIILAILLIGVIVMINRYGSFSSLKYEKYSSKDSELNVTMDYVSGWRYSEHRGSYGSYAQVQFIEPEDKDICASMVLTVRRSSKVKFKPLTVEAMADDLIARRMKLKDARALSRSKRRLLSSQAIDIELNYKTLDKLRSIDAKFVPIEERVILFKIGDKFYSLRYTNIEEEFKKFERAFYHCAKTLRLKK